jgi:carbamoyltransferase
VAHVRNRFYVGLSSSFHDSALAIVDPMGVVIFAEATERFLQYKRALNIAPDLHERTADLLQTYCDRNAEIVVAHTWSESFADRARAGSGANAVRSGNEVTPPEFMRVQHTSRRYAYASQITSLVQRGTTFEYEIQRLAGRANTIAAKRSYDHHLTHAAAACFTSPYEEAACAIVDGYGEDQSVACYLYQGSRLTPLAPHRGRSASLGVFFQDVCAACGFGYMTGEEWKVMGLAAHGDLDQPLYDILRRMIAVEELHFVSPDGAALLHARRDLYEQRRKPGEAAITAANLARAGQHIFTETLLGLLQNLSTKVAARNLVYSGGCALNSSTNGQILAQTPFRSLYVPAAPADDGNAIGAALLAYQEDHPEYQPARTFQTPYCGSSLSSESLQNLERFSHIRTLRKCRGEAPRLAAKRLAEGQVVGWVQGRAEFGPRALGNRSILADARRADAKETLNARVKFREEFRPFAPAILHEHGPDWFQDYQESPYMERTLLFRPEVRMRIPGAVHHDGTGRLQTVKQEWNPSYHALLQHYFELTGVPLIINTSFNIMGKPISHSVEDVLGVFYTSGLDAVFIDDLMIEK